MIGKLQQLIADFFSYINSLPLVDQIKEFYDSLQERDKNIVKLVSVFLLIFIVYSIFSSALSTISNLEDQKKMQAQVYTELNRLNKIILEKGRVNFKSKEYVSLSALLEECELDGVFAEDSKIDLRESSKDIQRGLFKEYRVWAKYKELSLAQFIKFLYCVQSPTNGVNIASLKLLKNIDNNSLLDIEFEASYKLKGKKSR